MTFLPMSSTLLNPRPGIFDGLKLQYAAPPTVGAALAPQGGIGAAFLDKLNAPLPLPRSDGHMPGMPTARVPMAARPMGKPPGSEILPGVSPQGEAPKSKKLFGKGGAGWAILGAIGDGLRGMSEQPPLFAPMMMRQREQEMELEAEERKRMAPRVEQVGNTVGFLDPSSGSFSPMFTAPGAGGQYAMDRGLEPGTPEYQEAVRQYRLGSWGDDALAAKTDLEGVRYGYRDDLQDQRLEVTRRGQDITSRDRRRGQDLTARTSTQNNVRTNDTRRGAYSYSNPPSRGGKGGSEARAVAANGKPIVVRGGAWVYADSGKPVE